MATDKHIFSLQLGPSSAALATSNSSTSQDPLLIPNSMSSMTSGSNEHVIAAQRKLNSELDDLLGGGGGGSDNWDQEEEEGEGFEVDERKRDRSSKLSTSTTATHNRPSLVNGTSSAVSGSSTIIDGTHTTTTTTTSLKSIAKKEQTTPGT